MTLPRAKIVFRIAVCRLKFARALPEIGWSEVTRMCVTPNRTWPTHRLAIPDSTEEGRVRFRTPVGTICWGMENRNELGLLVLEQLCAIYQCPQVQIHPGDIVLDLGAHVGTFTRFALNRGASMVIAVEPEPSHAAHLRVTFRDEVSSGRVHVENAAAWHRPGRARFKSDGVGSKLEETGSCLVRLATVDGIISELGLTRVDFIKADIEGAERHALEGAVQTITRLAPKMVICAYHLPDDIPVLTKLVSSLRSYFFSLNGSRSQAFFWPK